jgi:hypothetical protein
MNAIEDMIWRIRYHEETPGTVAAENLAQLAEKELAELRRQVEQANWFRDQIDKAFGDYKPYDEIILLRKVLQDTREHRDRLNDQCAQLRVELEEALDLLWACSEHNDYVGRKTLMEAIDDYLSAHRPTSPKKSLGETL